MANDLTRRDETGATMNSLIAVIERAANNPAVEIDKMERLLAMQERILDRNAEALFNAEFAEMQALMPRIRRDGQIEVPRKNQPAVTEIRGKYAKFEDINEVVLPILREHGFGISFRTAETANGRTSITCILRHRGGWKEQTSLTLPADTTGSKNNVQAIGSAVSYGRRYTMCSILNIITADTPNNPLEAALEVDDDGDAAGGEVKSRSDQVIERVASRSPKPKAAPLKPNGARLVMPDTEDPSETIEEDDNDAGMRVEALSEQASELLGKLSVCSSGEYETLVEQGTQLVIDLTDAGLDHLIPMLRTAAVNAKHRLDQE